MLISIQKEIPIKVQKINVLLIDALQVNPWMKSLTRIWLKKLEVVRLQTISKILQDKKDLLQIHSVNKAHDHLEISVKTLNKMSWNFQIKRLHQLYIFYKK